ncbi:hypothetical protein RND81_02G197700 [Saponaria officinalis]|uniref:Uncharacterized protein n=1 Tax=Saponaria officinalis TaxID=3572 RepID=A0AAW1MUU0_SAPOF
MAVYASLYSYDRNEHIMRAFFKCYCVDTNTLHTEEGKLSISLWDLHKLGGLPINGKVYDETIPRLKALRDRDSSDGSRVPATCEHLFVAYRRLARQSKDRNKISVVEWINYWCVKERVYHPPGKGGRQTITRPKSTGNPSGEITPRPPNDWTRE